MQFKIIHKEGKARAGKLITPHGEVETPNFSPVGTQGTVKALSPKDLNEIGVQMVLANTYHLMLRPGDELIKKLGGLHKFMNWNSPIMTDSGGFQVFSLGAALEFGDSKVVEREAGNGKWEARKEITAKPRLNRITEEGVEFQSHLDGSKHILTPETSMEIQRNLGADLIVAFDDHESSHFTKVETKKSLELTERWGLRSLEAYRKSTSQVQRMRPARSPLIFGVIHGGLDKGLRISSAKFTDKHFSAIAVGGIYGKRKQLYQLVDWVTDIISEEKPRHLLGIGEVEDLFEDIARGVDLFDCVGPTRRARNGSIYVSPPFGQIKNNFTFSIVNSQFKSDSKPLDSNCKCYTCQNFSRAYIRHLFLAKEILYHKLATYHNVFFITKLMEKIRKTIKNGGFKKLKNMWMG
ncbi:hypothetical protein A3F00_02690 [Candidatus Daviesbacteria bacterium RIFCSPHIGHO2_12_FULL_37_11]|uniref:Queuine tRNA-ribosyltransferase n=1 Tax=Candidatus Daviesbacteria bacterium RIFCSPHIGHO2_12_FULL_37_11 TaxID=1797777 RepID=A0A1F5KEH1_9BACT|nr:MAG: hypothetical protein A2111_01025 [Candidatus Daviesbacteria bacterium GWA1_38_6]OGE16248.1 MAG: hypothetical protein A2769_02515 [Candidatus Daviesbacteria bacterium RIFCSPHIGHO2_01_FULL_37_27]OGE39343.1 MAG: hypothetical protein A3F00_02690 [Candidatus Daviesbacteria bacterium RIFCSPHIGHO2_12_FULL_37_11]OGE45139.1 MAG: hypothetical protein A3B39_01860 [Candidatus Daviesbacteria bacterium RIFCSPLOWO2_01_FULL_37_10]